MILPKGDAKFEDQTVVVGLKRLRIIRLNGLSKITDHPLLKLCEQAPDLEQLEVSRCETLTDFSIQSIIRNCANLKFIDINGIPAFKYSVLDEMRTVNPNLCVRRYHDQEVDLKDNGLRVPLIVKNDKKKKKKKGKGKKKK
jgi:hypothetical protein